MVWPRPFPTADAGGETLCLLSLYRSFPHCSTPASPAGNDILTAVCKCAIIDKAFGAAPDKNTRKAEYAPVMELVDMRDLGSRAAMRVGSSPFRRTSSEKSPKAMRKASGLFSSPGQHQGVSLLPVETIPGPAQRSRSVSCAPASLFGVSAVGKTPFNFPALFRCAKSMPRCALPSGRSAPAHSSGSAPLHICIAWRTCTPWAAPPGRTVPPGG